MGRDTNYQATRSSIERPRLYVRANVVSNQVKTTQRSPPRFRIIDDLRHIPDTAVVADAL